VAGHIQTQTVPDTANPVIQTYKNSCIQETCSGLRGVFI